MPDDIDYALLLRHLDGSASERDEATLRRWVAFDAERSDAVRLLSKVWVESKGVAPEWDTERALQDFRRRLADCRGSQRQIGQIGRAGLVGHGAHPPTARRDSGSRRRAAGAERITVRRWYRDGRVWGTAAMLTVVAGVSASWLSSRIASRSGDDSDSMRSFATSTGQRANLELTDGSRVILGARSTLRVPTRFGSRSREVQLEGEAYFDVTHDAARPFSVRSACCLTRALGTRFDVRAHAGEPTVTVAVASGRVALARRDDVVADSVAAATPPVLLAAGDVGRLGHDGEARVERAADIERLTGWTTGRIAFVDAPLPHVLDELERWYDVDLVLGDSSLARRHLTTSLRQESVEQMIDVLSAALEVRASRAGRTVTLHPRRRR